jgi:hypothetical protein
MISAARFRSAMYRSKSNWPSSNVLIKWLAMLLGCAMLSGISFADAIAATAGPVVKRSTSGICHDENSPSYAATKRYKSYDSLEHCLKDGGRLPKNLPHEQPVRSADAQDDASDHAGADPKLILVGLAGAAVVSAGGIWLWRRRGRREDPEEALARRKWEAHRLESRVEKTPQDDEVSQDEEIFKRRHHRWDPWLKRIGYFDKSKKP